MCATELKFSSRDSSCLLHTVSSLKIPCKNIPIVFSINRDISLFCGPSTWKLCESRPLGAAQYCDAGGQAAGRRARGQLGGHAGGPTDGQSGGQVVNKL